MSVYVCMCVCLCVLKLIFIKFVRSEGFTKKKTLIDNVNIKMMFGFNVTIDWFVDYFR